MDAEPIKVFVYGTLKPGQANYDRYCAGKIIEATEAIAYGQLFDLPLGYPAMTAGDRPVRGYLLTFADPSLLASLDRLEDYDSERLPEENEYQRQHVDTFALTGKPLARAWAYLMSPQQVQHYDGVFLPSGVWRERLNRANP
jgi:gamma-glutamylcyclotransferase (GGCT)/AIG2-like uncharacterized protein YtfP